VKCRARLLEPRENSRLGFRAAKLSIGEGVAPSGIFAILSHDADDARHRRARSSLPLSAIAASAPTSINNGSITSSATHASGRDLSMPDRAVKSRAECG